jgi:hypothetical protein
VLAIGDSVVLGDKSRLLATVPGIAVDAKVSRQFWDAVSVVQAYQSFNALPATLVIHLGTNGRITPDLFDQLMRAIGPEHQVYFLTARVPRIWETEDNANLHAGMARWPKQVHVLEWRDYAGCHDDWFVNDGFHLRTPGQYAYAQFVLSGLDGKAPNTCTK